MKKFLKILAYTLGALLLILVLALAFFYAQSAMTNSENMALLGNEAPTIT